MENPNSNVPPSEQCEIIKKLREEINIEDGDIIYLISLSWFKKWQRYVGYYKTNTSSNNQNCGEIDNNDLFWYNKFDTTKKYKSDYIMVTKEMWDKLYEWYGGGPIIKFPVVYTGEDYIPNTDPLVLTIVYKNEEKEISTGKEVLVSTLKKKIYKLFNISPKTETKLVDFWNGSFLKYLNEDMSINSNSIYDKQKVLVCRKHKNGKYKFDNQGSSSYFTQNAGPAPAPGVVGLSNLGNTCYFNSGTQCLLHSQPLIHIFLHTEWKNDLNRKNPLGMKGELAEAFASLMKSVWDKNAKRYVAPSDLKSVMGKNIPQFAGYDQQDSQELITFMLDGLHEDLNKRVVKPQVEPVDGDGTNDEVISQKSWENFKMRNDSVIVDSFYGQFRSSLDCPNCKKKTVIFDSFNIISLPISMPKLATKDLIFVPADFTQEYKKIKISVPPDASFERVSTEVSKEIGRKVNVIVGSEGTNSINWGLTEPTTYYSYYSYRTTSTSYAFEVPEEYNGKFLVPCKIQLNMKYYYSSSRYEDAAGPVLIPVSDVNATEDEIAEEATKILKCLWEPCDITIANQCQEMIDKLVDDEKLVEDETPAEEENTDMNENVVTSENTAEVDKTAEEDKSENKEDNESPNSPTEKAQTAENVTKFKAKISGYTYSNYYNNYYSSYYSYNNKRSLAADKHYENLSTKVTNLKIRPKYMTPKSGFSFNCLFRHYDETNSSTNDGDSDNQNESDSVDLSQCFKFFSTPDILDEENKWFCPKCREFVCANKKMDIWKVPNILILHLKRFIQNEFHARKDESLVHFPEFIDLKDFVIGPQKEERLIYRLYAVSEHSGFMGGGHYTAHAKVVEKGNVNGSWYYFNDSSVSQSDYNDTQNREAYVLFYQKYDPEQKSDAEDQKEEEDKNDKEEDSSSSGYCDSADDGEEDEITDQEKKKASTLLHFPQQSSSSDDDDFKKDQNFFNDHHSPYINPNPYNSNIIDSDGPYLTTNVSGSTEMTDAQRRNISQKISSSSSSSDDENRVSSSSSDSSDNNTNVHPISNDSSSSNENIVITKNEHPDEFN